MRNNSDTDTLVMLLSEKFPEHDVLWRIQKWAKKPSYKINEGDHSLGWALVVPYLKGTAVQNRLDAVMTPIHWYAQYETFNNGNSCKLYLRFEDEWIYKQDGSEGTREQAFKGSFTDSLKRAAKQWGIGRYLSSVPPMFVNLYGNEFTDDEEKRTNRFYDEESKLSYFWNNPKLPAQYIPTAPEEKQ